MTSIAEIREAFSRVWKTATNQGQCFPLMTIPPDREHDADCIIHDAIDELSTLRVKVADLEKNNAELNDDLIRVMNERNEAEERGARKMAGIAERHWIGDDDDDREQSIERLMQLYREAKKKK